MATTKLLSEKGASVAVLDLQEPPENIPNTKFWRCDVSDDERVETCIKEAIEFASSEKKPIAGAVCCAGVAMAGRVLTLTKVANSDHLPERHTLLDGYFSENI